MPDLPTITVTDNQYARLASVLPGGTQGEKATAYRQLVRATLRKYVIDAEVRAAQAAAEATLASTINSINENPDNL